MASLDSIMKKYRRFNARIPRAASIEMGITVINRTPVLTGSLEASWHSNNGDPEAENVTIKTPNPSISKEKVRSVARTLEPGDTFSMANGKHYVRRIEYEGWSKIKAPNGMLRISIAEWNQMVNKSVAKVRGGIRGG